MTVVNWELEPGETIQEFIAAMILLDHPHGNLVTPSRGDRGVDIRVLTPGGYDIYQVKRYSRPLTPKQAKDIQQSWQTFVVETLPQLQVRSWNLVMPWDPTNERLEWLRALTAGQSFDCNWLGRATLIGMASRHARLVDYYFGGGADRIVELMAGAVAAGRPLPDDAPGEVLLEAAIERHLQLGKTLTELDPFYRYVVEVRDGRFAELPWGVDSDAAMTKYQQLDAHHYVAIRLYPLSAASAQLRPIRFSIEFQFEAGSAEQSAIDAFRRFGAPFADVPGVVTKLSGPPGVGGDGPARFMFMAKAAPTSIPDLELRLVDASGVVLDILQLTDLQLSRSTDGGAGMWLSGADPSGTLRIQFFLDDSDGCDGIVFITESTAGQTPANVLPAVRFTAAVVAGTGLALAVRGGQSIGQSWWLETSELADRSQKPLQALEALQMIQRHTFDRVVVPDFNLVTTEEVINLIQTARILAGHSIKMTWEALYWTVADDGPNADEEFCPVITRPIVLRLGDATYSVDVDVRIVCRARFEDPTARRAARQGDILRVVPGSEPYAVMSAVPRGEASTSLSEGDRQLS